MLLIMAAAYLGQYMSIYLKKTKKHLKKSD